MGPFSEDSCQIVRRQQALGQRNLILELQFPLFHPAQQQLICRRSVGQMSDYRVQVAVFDLQGGEPRLQRLWVFIGVHGTMVCVLGTFSKQGARCYFTQRKLLFSGLGDWR